MDSQGPIQDSQHGFVHGKSSLMNILDFFKEVTKRMDEGRAVDVVNIDLSKAFDKVTHGRLVWRIRSHGILGKLANWIQN